MNVNRGGNVAEQRYNDKEVVVDTAKIGCCYAQPGSTDKDTWDIRRLRFDHNHGEKDNGYEVAHNHDCVKNVNLFKFKECYSPFYLDALEKLTKIYPEDEDYSKGYEIAYNNQFADGGGGGATTPPCVLAVLDTWFEYSDVEISKQYAEVKKTMAMFESDMNYKVGEISKWAFKEIREKKSELEKEEKESGSFESAALNAVLIPKLTLANSNILDLVLGKDELIREVNDYWDKILVFRSGYQSALTNLGSKIDTYVKDWKTELNNVYLDTTSKECTDFFDYYTNLYENAKAAGEGMLKWEKETENALLTTSFLICKCGGKIENTKSGQQHELYCNKLFDKLVLLLQNASKYFEDVLVQNIVFGGVTSEESNFSAATTAISLSNIKTSFDKESEFILADGTKAIEFRFITKGYNKERETILSALIGLLVLTPMTAAATAAAGPIAGVGIAACTWGIDGAKMMSQDVEDQFKNEADDLKTVVTNTTDLASNMASWYVDGTKRPGNTMKALSALGEPMTVINYVTMLAGMFYTSDEDWIQEIEITVFTTYMAHIIKQEYDEEVNEKDVFDGRRMVRTKSKVEYSTESLKTINWDELGGVSVDVDKNFGGDDPPPQSVKDPNEVKKEIEKNTNGELN